MWVMKFLFLFTLKYFMSLNFSYLIYGSLYEGKILIHLTYTRTRHAAGIGAGATPFLLLTFKMGRVFNVVQLLEHEVFIVLLSTMHTLQSIDRSYRDVIMW